MADTTNAPWWFKLIFWIVDKIMWLVSSDYRHFDPEDLED